MDTSKRTAGGLVALLVSVWLVAQDAGTGFQQRRVTADAVCRRLGLRLTADAVCRRLGLRLTRVLYAQHTKTKNTSGSVKQAWTEQMQDVSQC